MKKKTVSILLALALASTMMLGGCSKEDTVTTTAQETSSISEAEEELSIEEEEVKAETEELTWPAEDITLLTDILAGIEDTEITADAGIEDLKGLLEYDRDIVKSVMINTTGITFGEAGEYEAVYTILMDREALVDYITENSIEAEAFDGLEDLSCDKIRVTVTTTITVAAEEEPEPGSGEEEDADTEDTVETTEPGSADSSTKSSSSSSSTGSSSSNSSASNSSSSSNKSTGSSSSSSSKSSSSSSGSSSSSSSNSSSGSSSSSSSSGSSSAATHTHSYSAKVTKEATCGSAGVKTYTCSCGDSYTESIPATGNHTWEAVYKTVEEDVYEEKLLCKYSGCGYYCDDESIMMGHINNKHAGAASWTVRMVKTGTTSTQVVDYYKCSVCGATK